MYIHREIEQEIFSFLDKKEALAIIGARQTGKTTLLKHILSLLEKEGKKVKYITFEKPGALELFDAIDDFIEFYKNYQVIIIDEFQYAKEGGKNLKYLYDTTDIKLIISGSSSLEIIFHTSKYMVGRMHHFNLWPFSFREYLSYKDHELFTMLNQRMAEVLTPEFEPPKAYSPAINHKIGKYFTEYLIYGGYPAVVLTDKKAEKPKVLESIFENYLLRDVRTLLQLATEHELIKLVRFLAAQTGNILDFNELSNVTGLHYKKMLSHLEILKQTYIIDLLQPFFRNKQTELIKNPKIYFTDTGFRNLVISDFRHPEMRNDFDTLVENFVFTSLKRKYGAFNPINFWRTKSKAEVDFILQTQNQIIPIEVKNSENPALGKSYYSFIEKYQPSKGLILNKKRSEIKEINHCKISFIPFLYL